MFRLGVILATLCIAVGGRSLEPAFRHFLQASSFLDVVQTQTVRVEVPLSVVRPMAIIFISTIGEAYEFRTTDVDSFHRLPLGEYAVSSRYEGGLTRPSGRLVVEADRMNVVELRSELVGGLRLSLPTNYCYQHEATIEVRRIRADQLTDEPVTRGTTDGCFYQLGGLEPGRYAIASPEASGDELTIGRTPFSVKPQEWSVISLQSSPVTVRGVVAVGTDAARMIAVRLDSIRDATTATAMSNDMGLFATTLDHPGDYRASVIRDGRVLTVGTVKLVAGENVVRFNLNQGGLRLSISGSDHLGAKVYIVHKGSTAATTVTDVRTPPAIDNLEFGLYGVWAVSGSKTSRVYQQVVIDQLHPFAAISIALVHSRPRTLYVCDQDGTAMTDVRLDLGRGRLDLLQQTAGNYTVDSIAPGVPMLLRAQDGRTVCHIAADESRMVVFQKVREFSLTPEGQVDYNGAIVTGATLGDCAVPLNRLVVRRETERVVLKLPSGAFSLSSNGRTFQFTVPTYLQNFH